jgi:hypothetical protein
MKLETLKEIFENGGCMTSEQLRELCGSLPDIKVGVKFGTSPRGVWRASEAIVEIANRCGNGEDWVRECFLPCSVIDPLGEVFGWAQN